MCGWVRGLFSAWLLGIVARGVWQEGPPGACPPPPPRVLSRPPSAPPPLATALRSAPRPLKERAPGQRGLWGQSRDKGLWNRREEPAQAPTPNRGAGTALSEHAPHLSLRVQNFVPLLPLGVNMMMPTAAQIHQGRGGPQFLPQTSGFPGVPGANASAPAGPGEDGFLGSPCLGAGVEVAPCVHTACRGHGSACPSPSSGLCRAPECPHDAHGSPQRAPPG